MVFAGLTIFGTGDQASVSLGFAFCCAEVLFSMTVEMIESKMILFIGLINCFYSACADWDGFFNKYETRYEFEDYELTIFFV
jgi:hypothetical protein